MDCLIILVVTVVTLFLNLAIAVGIGVVIAVFVFAWKSSNSVQSNTFIKVSKRTGESRMKVVELSGPIYFGSRSRFLRFFNPETDPDLVEIHFRHSDIHDFSGIQVINQLGEAYANKGKKLALRSIREQSMTTIRHAHKLFDQVDVVLDEEVAVTADPWRPIAVFLFHKLNNFSFDVLHFLWF